MGAEMGVTTSIFPSDDSHAPVPQGPGPGEGLDASSRRMPDAAYDRVIEVDLSALEPLVAGPHSPGNVVKLSELEGMKVDQVCIGSCTNSSYKDLVTVAAMLQGRTRSIPT